MQPVSVLIVFQELVHGKKTIDRYWPTWHQNHDTACAWALKRNVDRPNCTDRDDVQDQVYYFVWLSKLLKPQMRVAGQYRAPNTGVGLTDLVGNIQGIKILSEPDVCLLDTVRSDKGVNLGASYVVHLLDSLEKSRNEYRSSHVNDGAGVAHVDLC
jgi:hypothetical protein